VEGVEGEGSGDSQQNVLASSSQLQQSIAMSIVFVVTYSD